MSDVSFSARCREVARVFLKIGAMSYAGPATMGLMQVELQEKRAWLSKERFLEGLALVNMLLGAGGPSRHLYRACTYRLVRRGAGGTVFCRACVLHHVQARRYG